MDAAQHDHLAHVSERALFVGRLLWLGPEAADTMMQEAARAFYGASLMADGDDEAWLRYLRDSQDALATCTLLGEFYAPHQPRPVLSEEALARLN